MTAIVDYGVGNLFSLGCSFAAIGESVRVTSDPAEISSADRIVLPGVGAFGDAAEKLRISGLGELIRGLAGEGKPLLGICLGMQLLFDESLEYGVFPHGKRPLLRFINEGDCVYFVHSFFADTEADHVIATAEYGAPLTAAVAKGSVYGCQFHPEKSGDVGLKILKAFCAVG